jgi:arylsulfatase A-like enzyme
VVRNVVCCCLDTVRKDVFDAFATRLQRRAGLRYEQCRAASCWSVPSHASMVTGRLPSDHGVHAGRPRLDALDADATLPGDLPDHRFLGVSANVYAGSAYGFDALFDEFVDVQRDHRYPDGLDVSTFIDEATEPGLGRYAAVCRACLGHDRPGASLANAVAGQVHTLTGRNGPLSSLPTPFDDGARPVRRAALSQIRASDDPFVLFCNLMEGHEPHRDTLPYDRDLYDVPRGWSSRDLQTWDAVDPTPETEREIERYRDVYGAAVDYLDRFVDGFVDAVQAATDRETTVVVTADHGENLAYPDDDGHLGHVNSLTEGLLHVPLVVVNPPGGDHGTVTDLVSHLDLRRLLAGLARGTVPDIGRSSVPAEVVDVTPGNDPLVETDPDYWRRHRRCVVTGDRKYEWDDAGGSRVLALDRDQPCRQRVVADEQVPADADDAFEVSLSAYDPGPADADPVDDAVEDRLRDLGYR